MRLRLRTTLPAYTAAEKVTSNIVHTPGVTTDLAASQAPDDAGRERIPG